MDMVVTTARFPGPGETILGGAFAMYPGGKGANQAVAAAKLGGKVTFIGKTGRDVFGEKLVESLTHHGVHLEHLAVDPGHPTGVAFITVDRTGQNEIVVVSGSNMQLTPHDVSRRKAAFSGVAILLLQLEIPLGTVIHAARLARLSHVPVVLNPAPARRLPRSLLKMVDYLTPNEPELEQLSGVRVRGNSGAERAARLLLDRGVGNVLVTMGAHGCLLVTRSATVRFPACRVRPVDTTAAGDAFNGALAFALASGRDLERAIPFANAAAALSVTRMGAQSSMPTARELRAFLRKPYAPT